MKIYVDSIACEQRQLETQKIINYLKLNNIEIVNSPKESNYAILVACAVDASSQNTSIIKLDRIISEIKPGTKLIVGGCLPSISPYILKKYQPYELFSPRDITSKIGNLFDHLGNIKFSDVEEPNKSIFDKTTNTNISPRDNYDNAKQGYKIRINDGCLQQCSYCRINEATGKLRSKQPEVILKEVQKAEDTCEKTIMILGGDTGAYGYDLNTRLYKLLEEIAKIQNLSSLFIHDFNINWLIKDFDAYTNYFKLNEHEHKLNTINFPIQSGSDRILKSMKRNYTSEEIILTLNKLKDINPSLLLGTHIIVGFPGETNDDFKSTINVLNQVSFDFFTCFPYYEHSLAKSAKLQNKVSLENIDLRLSQLQQLFVNEIKIIR